MSHELTTGRTQWCVSAVSRARLMWLIPLFLAVASLASAPAAQGRRSATTIGERATLFVDPLVVPSVQSLDGSQQMGDALWARHVSPEATRAREDSQTKFAALNASAAAKLASETFPEDITKPAAPPELPAGATVTGYLTNNAAQIELPSRERSLVESLTPIAVQTSPGHREPIDLGLTKTGNGFEPRRALVPVAIPSRVGQGASLTLSSISLVPTDAHGRPLSAAGGEIDGAVVFYGGAGASMDTAVKPTVYGLEEDVILRSPSSPRRLYYRVVMPVGARLVQDERSGAVAVNYEGATLATLDAPAATDASGWPVPVAMRAHGDLVALTVGGQPAAEQFPLVVDPELHEGSDRQLAEEGKKRSNWEFHTSNPEHFSHSAGTAGLTTSGSGYSGGQYADWGYQTQGNSHIWELSTESEAHNSGGHIESFLELEGPGPVHENKVLLSTEQMEPTYERKYAHVCPKNGAGEEACVAASGNADNIAAFQQSAGNAGSGFSDTMHEAIVSLAEPGTDHSTTHFNKETEQLEVEPGKPKWTNALYGKGIWLSHHQGALAGIAEDPGIGVAETRVEYESFPGHWEVVAAHEYLEKEDACKGVLCYPKHEEAWTLPLRLPDGEDEIRYHAESAMPGTGSGEAEGTERVKVDTTPPRELHLVGLPYGNELREAPYTLEAVATDGEREVPSSGIRSIKLYVDKREKAQTAEQKEESGMSCNAEKGPCTGHAKWTLNGAELGAGHHAIAIEAEDNAGNIEVEHFTITVRHSTPVAMGPGSVDLESGGFALGASDASLAGGLMVARTYSSRDTTAGAEGPLGPQWSISVGSDEGLSELADGAMMLTAANGGQTLFAPTEEHNPAGELIYESPPGNSNLKLTLKENQQHEKLAYYLRDAADHSDVEFTAPAGWGPTPRYERQWGSAGEGQGQFEAPSSVATAPNGNMWTVDRENARLEEFTPEGTLIRAVSFKENGTIGHTSRKWGIAINQRTGNIYVTDHDCFCIEEYSETGAFIRAAGNIQSPTGYPSIAVDPGGNVWVAGLSPYGGDVREWTENLTVVQTFGPNGTGAGEIKEPHGITYAAGKLYISDTGNNRIDEFTTAGKYEGTFGTSGSGNEKLSNPQNIATDPETGNLYVADTGNNRIEVFNPKGEYVTQFGTAGSAPGEMSGDAGVTVGPSGAVYVADTGNNDVQQWRIPPERTLWVPTISEGTLATNTLSYAYKRTEVQGRQIVEPIEALAPKPMGAECPINGEFKLGNKEEEERQRGCRALTFAYDTTGTTASGEGPNEWGNYVGHLESVSFHAWNPRESKMEAIEVARYLYDKQGRLRAEWDPRIEKSSDCAGSCAALKTTYGYDEEGHITALTPPGQQPWIMRYGTSAQDSGTGRLLSVWRAPPSTPTGSGNAPVASAVPTLSSATPVAGEVLRIASAPAWSNSPLSTVSYRWERCNAEGRECTVVQGAVNRTYRVPRSDIGHTLLVQVSATNAAGTTTVSSYPTKAVPSLSYFRQLTAPGTGHGNFGAVAGEAAEPNGDLWIADRSNNRLVEVGPHGEYVTEIAGLNIPPSAVALGQAQGGATVVWTVGGNIEHHGRVEGFTSSKNSKGELTWTKHSEFSSECEWPQGVAAQGSSIWVANSECNSVTEYGEQGNVVASLKSPTCEPHTECTSGPFARPEDLAVTPSGNLWVASDTSRVEEVTQSGEAVLHNGEPVYLHRANNNGAGGGLGESALQKSYDVAVDAHGNVWTGGVVEGCAQEYNEYGQFVGTAGTDGEGEGQCSFGRGVAVSAEGTVWVTDEGRDRVEEFDYVGRAYRLGEGFGEPIYGLDAAPLGEDAVDANGNLWVADTGNSRLEEFNEHGEHLRSVGSTKSQFENQGCSYAMCMPLGVAIDKQGNIWVTDTLFHQRVDEFNAEGHEVRHFQVPMFLPWGIAVDSSGHIFVSSPLIHQVDEFNEEGKELASFGSAGTGPGQLEHPEGIALDSSGHLWIADVGNDRVVQCMIATGECKTAISARGVGPGQLEGPSDVLIDASGSLWVSDAATNRVEEFTSTGEYLGQLGHNLPWYAEPQGPRGMALGVHGEMFVSDGDSNAIQVYGSGALAEEPTPVEGTTIHYEVPISGSSAPYKMGASEVAAWGQRKDDPVEATAISPPDEPQGWPASGYKRAVVYYLDAQGRQVNVATPSNSSYGSVATTEYNEYNDVVRSLTPDNRVKALETGWRSEEVASQLSTEYTYNGEGEKEPEAEEPGSELILKRGPLHRIRLERPGTGEEKEEEARELTTYLYDKEETETGEIRKAPEGETHHLLTETQSYAEPAGHHTRVEERTDKTSYAGQGGLGWEIRAPTSVTTDPRFPGHTSGLSITHATIYYTEREEPNAPACGHHPEWEGLICEVRGPEGEGGNSAHDTRTIYYSPKEEAGVSACDNRREWAGLVCETVPAKQPESTPAPKLPETTTKYSIYDQPETIVEAFAVSPALEAVTRTKMDIYDAAGRLEISETRSTSSTDKPLHSVTYGYSTATGAQISQTTEGAKGAEKIESSFNSIGELIEYKDAKGNTAHYSYEEPDGLIKEISDSSDEGKTHQRYTYDETTKQLVRLEDVAPGTAGPGEGGTGTFTVSYDAEGKMTSEVYPNSMCAKYAYDAIGQATRLEYVKSANCAAPGARVWYSDSQVASIHGETLSEQSSLAATNYSYDQAGRLEQVQETPAGKGCAVRVYGYDLQSDRRSLTTRQPGSAGECQGTGGTPQIYEYDEGDRLKDPGTSYDPLGNATRLPPLDSGGPEGGKEITSEFYVDNQVQKQSQNGTTLEYAYDPEGRVLETSSGTKTVVTHYDGPGEAIAWTDEGEGKWTRDVPGIDGSLSAIQTNGGTPVLQLHDLKGDIVATAADNTTAEELISTYNSTEYGVPSSEKSPPKYAWLGASGTSSEPSFGSGVIVEGGTSYVPQTGRLLQSESVEPPGLPWGSGAGAQYERQEEPWAVEGRQREASEAPGLEATREREAAEAACRANLDACEIELVDPVKEAHLSPIAAFDLGSAAVALYAATSPHKIMDWVTKFLHIDFISKLRDWIEQHILGVSLSEEGDWAGHMGTLLLGCSADYALRRRHPNASAYCWLWFTTNVYHVRPFEPISGVTIYEYELPNFKQPAQVKYCPQGGWCYGV